MLGTQQIMKFLGLGGSPTTPQSTPGGQKQRPVTQHYTPRYDGLSQTSSASNVSFSNSHLKPPSQSASNDLIEADYPPLTAPVAPMGASIAPFRTSRMPPVLFYDKNDPFYEFTLFSPHDVTYKGKRYPTGEHLFQALKVRVVSSSRIGADAGSCSSFSMAIYLVPGQPSPDRGAGSEMRQKTDVGFR